MLRTLVVEMRPRKDLSLSARTLHFPTGCSPRSAVICENTLLASCDVSVEIYEMKLGAAENGKTIFQSGFTDPQKPVPNLLASNNCTFLFGDNTGHLFSLDYFSRTVKVVVGSDIPGCTDGVGRDAQLGWPYTLSFHPSEPFAIMADRSTCTLQRVDIPEYRITTVAGQCGVAGEKDGAGQQANFGYPITVFFTSSQELYLGEGLATIRTIELPDYNVTTVIGLYEDTTLLDGVGTHARVWCPTDFYKAPEATSILFADFYYNVIRSFTIPDYVVTTVIGSKTGADGFNPDARLAYPCYFFPLGDLLFVGDHNNNKLRIVTLPSARVDVSTFAILPTGALPNQLIQCGSKLLALDEANKIYELSNSPQRDVVSLTLNTGRPETTNDIVMERAVGNCTYLIVHGSGHVYRYQYHARSLETVMGGGRRGCFDGKGRNVRLEVPYTLAYHPLKCPRYLESVYV